LNIAPTVKGIAMVMVDLIEILLQILLKLIAAEAAPAEDVRLENTDFYHFILLVAHNYKIFLENR
jgi:hypothetical protein